MKQDKISSSEARRQIILYQKQAVECWQQAAEQGYAKAQYQLGWYYYHYGRDDSKNKKEFEWYSKAAEQGYVLAQYELGFLYGCGLGVLRNIKTSYDWYEKAAEGGMASAAAILGDWYSQGKSRNCKKALYWYIRAFELGINHQRNIKLDGAMKSSEILTTRWSGTRGEPGKELATLPITLRRCMKPVRTYQRTFAKP